MKYVGTPKRHITFEQSTQPPTEMEAQDDLTLTTSKNTHGELLRRINHHLSEDQPSPPLFHLTSTSLFHLSSAFHMSPPPEDQPPPPPPLLKPVQEEAQDLPFLSSHITSYSTASPTSRYNVRSLSAPTTRRRTKISAPPSSGLMKPKP